MSYFKELFPKMIRYKLARLGLTSPGTPINLTFSVTNLCQSRCKTCSIWELYLKNPEKFRTELTLSEIEKIFQSIGHVYIFNVSGGEPFLRKDFTEIIQLACKYLTPGIIHIPTNAISVELIIKKIEKILEFLKAEYPGVRLTVKPSLDHIGNKHDAIRGVSGNFEKVMTLFHRLKAFQQKYPDFHVELGTVISRWNVEDIHEISAYITGLGSDSYRNEIAEHRSEMFNRTNSITPDPDQYERAITKFVDQIRQNMKHRSLFHQITNAFRLEYYKLAIQILRKNIQIIPCYAGISNVHVSPYGDIWACCTLGYDHSMGNLRDNGYDFHKIWNSPKALEVRRKIRSKACACPLANQTYSNMLLHWRSLFRVIFEIINNLSEL